MKTMSTSWTLARWTAELDYHSIPAPVMAAAKRLIADTVAVGWAGAHAVGNGPVHDLMVDLGGKPESTLWVDGIRVPVTQAAFVNGMCASALDFDSVHDEATVHPDIILVPALLATAERVGASGKVVLTAYVAGSEMLVRLGLAVKQNPAWFLTSVLGGFACAAACAKLLGMPAEGIHRAMGICLSRAAGTQQTLLEGSFTKRLQTAFCARDGVEAALLASVGVTSPSQIFEGKLAFEAKYVPLDHERIVRNLGTEFHFPSLTIKDYPSCFCNHAAILAAREVVGRAEIRASDVERCEVILPAFSARMVGAPFSAGDSPQVAAQFSAQYSVASVLLRGGLTVDDIQPGAVLDPAVQALMTKIKVSADAQSDGKFTPATVIVHTRDGRVVERSVDEIPGTPARPMSTAKMRDKALICLTSGPHALTPSTANRLLDQIHSLDGMANMRNFWDVTREHQQ